MSIKPKISNREMSIFAVMTRMANENRAVNLSQGFPNFSIDNELLNFLKQCIYSDKHQYAPVAGDPQLLTSISKKIKDVYNIEVDAGREITVTNGATQALFTSISTVLNKGDEAIVILPAYDAYVPAIEMQGAKPVYFSMDGPNYRIDWQKLEKKINKKTKLIVVNNPHNPTGKIFSKEDLEALEEIFKKHKQLYLLSDEVYEHIVFEPKKHLTVLSSDLLRSRAFVCFSFGKILNATGWKIGYCVAPEDMMIAFRSLHQYQVFDINSFVQPAIAFYINNPKSYNTLATFYEERRDFFLNTIQDSKFDFIPSEGSYFQVINYKKISRKGDYKMAEELVKKYGVAVVPMSYFYPDKKDDKNLRVCFAKTDNLLSKGGKALMNFSNSK